jgi:hypothetical protein
VEFPSDVAKKITFEEQVTDIKHYASFNLCMHNGHTIEINHLWCDSLFVDFNVHHLSTSATIIVVKSEDLELFSIKRQLISYQKEG